MQRIIASSMLLVAACDLAGTDADALELVDAEARSAVGPESVAGVSAGDEGSWVVVETGEVKGWGRRWCDADGCLEPADIEPVGLPGLAMEVSSNGRVTAALLSDGSVWSWDASTAGALDPRPVGFDGAVAQVAMGRDFSCARLRDGRVQCKGIAGSTPPSWLSSAPLPVATAVDLSAGARHACALLESGAVQCWGSNDRGQLGSAQAAGPTVVALAGEAIEVEAGGEHTCALLESGVVQCWGSDAQRQLGHAGPGVGSVPLPEPAAVIAMGAAHGCAITETSERLYCWGGDAYGQLGVGEEPSAGIRRVDLGGVGATAVFAGANAWTTFVVLEHGGLRGFGRNEVGQAGYGDLLDDEDEARSVGNLPDIPIFRVPK